MARIRVTEIVNGQENTVLTRESTVAEYLEDINVKPSKVDVYVNDCLLDSDDLGNDLDDGDIIRIATKRHDSGAANHGALAI